MNWKNEKKEEMRGRARTAEEDEYKQKGDKKYLIYEEAWEKKDGNEIRI